MGLSPFWCTNRLDCLEATCAQDDGAPKGILRVQKGASVDNRMHVTPIRFVHPVGTPTSAALTAKLQKLDKLLELFLGQAAGGGIHRCELA